MNLFDRKNQAESRSTADLFLKSHKNGIQKEIMEWLCNGYIF